MLALPVPATALSLPPQSTLPGADAREPVRRARCRPRQQVLVAALYGRCKVWLPQPAWPFIYRLSRQSSLPQSAAVCSEVSEVSGQLSRIIALCCNVRAHDSRCLSHALMCRHKFPLFVSQDFNASGVQDVVEQVRRWWDDRPQHPTISPPGIFMCSLRVPCHAAS